MQNWKKNGHSVMSRTDLLKIIPFINMVAYCDVGKWTHNEQISSVKYGSRPVPSACPRACSPLEESWIGVCTLYRHFSFSLLLSVGWYPTITKRHSTILQLTEGRPHMEIRNEPPEPQWRILVQFWLALHCNSQWMWLAECLWISCVSVSDEFGWWLKGEPDLLAPKQLPAKKNQGGLGEDSSVIDVFAHWLLGLGFLITV